MFLFAQAEYAADGTFLLSRFIGRGPCDVRATLFQPEIGDAVLDHSPLTDHNTGLPFVETAPRKGYCNKCNIAISRERIVQCVMSLKGGFISNAG